MDVARGCVVVVARGCVAVTINACGVAKGVAVADGLGTIKDGVLVNEGITLVAVELGSSSVGVGFVGGVALLRPSARAKERPPTTSTTETTAYSNPLPNWRIDFMACDLWSP